ncbi:MAG: flagellar export chaperone FliS [Gammaproteobacteria bacterium]|nr:flagellar export chaperone FliS [Gammaproteobacteria bacterium]
MSFSAYQQGLKAYRQSNTYAGVECADPHHLIEMLLNGVSEHMAKARMGMRMRDTVMKCSSIDKSIAILDALRSSLDFDNGLEIAKNLDELYDYIQRTIIDAKLNNDEKAMESVADLINTIRQAWVSIPTDQRKQF